MAVTWIAVASGSGEFDWRSNHWSGKFFFSVRTDFISNLKKTNEKKEIFIQKAIKTYNVINVILKYTTHQKYLLKIHEDFCGLISSFPTMLKSVVRFFRKKREITFTALELVATMVRYPISSSHPTLESNRAVDATSWVLKSTKQEKQWTHEAD